MSVVKNVVVDIEELEKISPVFRGKWGNRLAKIFIRVFAMDRVNRVYGNSCNLEGADFAESLLNDLGVNYKIGNSERLLNLPEGSFITVSNHPYGGIDGIMLIDLMLSVRGDYKLMVNQLLSLVKTMNDNFISVKPKVGKKETNTLAGINGIRKTIIRIKDGHPMGFFPAGAVSMFGFKHLGVKDREWQMSLLKLIQSAKVPIIPIRFYDKNSILFYFLGLINWRIRLIRMPYELFNKRNKKVRLGIGNTISVEEQQKFTDLKSYGKFLRKSVYNMPKPESFITKTEFKALINRVMMCVFTWFSYN